MFYFVQLIVRWQAELAQPHNTSSVRRAGLGERVQHSEDKIQGWKHQMFAVDKELAEKRAALYPLGESIGH